MSERIFEQQPVSLDELRHYGVKGMKWGVINADRGGDRKAAKTEKRETKAKNLEVQAAKTDIRVKELKSERDALPTGVKGVAPRVKKNAEINQQVAYRDQLRKDANSIRKSGLTTQQKQLIVGGLLVGGVLALGYANVKMETGEFNALKLRGAALLRGKKFEFNRDKSLAAAMSPDEIIQNVSKGVNPNYASAGGQMNCRRCSFAYELRRRGFDVAATPTAIGAGHTETGLINALSPGQRNRNGAESLSSMVVGSGTGIRTRLAGDKRENPAETRSIVWPKAGAAAATPGRVAAPPTFAEIMGGASVNRAAARENILKSIGSQPKGARGEIVFDFGAFGHSMSYEIFDSGPVIFDNQKAVKYDLSDTDSISKMFDKWGDATSAEATRLDNLDLDYNFLARWATNA